MCPWGVESGPGELGADIADSAASRCESVVPEVTFEIAMLRWV